MEVTECSAQERKERLCELNWHILFLMKYCYLHPMQFMLKSWSCCAVNKNLMLKVLKHTSPSPGDKISGGCPVEIEDMLKIIGLLSL